MQLNTFEKFINTIHPNIKFTIEFEDNKINFRDLTNNRLEGKHDFSFFYKPTHTDFISHKSSLDLYQHKLSVFNSMIYRFVNNIRQVSLNRGYRFETIDQILQRRL